MEWSRVKSILIGVFAVVNIFLYCVYFSNTESPNNSIDTNTINNTIAILNSNSVSINKNIIPQKFDSPKTFDAVNRFASPKKCAMYLWENSQKYSLDYLNPKTTKYTASTFTYENNSLEKEKLTNKNSAFNYAKKCMNKINALDNISYEYAIYSVDEESYLVVFYPTFDGKIVADCKLSVSLNKNGITKIVGENWLMDTYTANGIANGKTPTEILIMFATEKAETPCTVLSIDMGYYIGSRDGENKTVTSVPVWKITTSSKHTYYYDMRNGDLL